MPEFFNIWHTAALLALLVAVLRPSYRQVMLYGAVVALPVLLLIPILSQSYFTLFSGREISLFFASQGLAVAGIGAVAAALYEALLRPHLTRQPKGNRRHFLYAGFGLLLAVVLFDLFKQPLLPSLMYGLGLNGLLALRYHRGHFYDLAFASLLLGVLYVFVYSAVLFDLPGDTGRFWFGEVLSGITLSGLPIEKVIAAFVFGLFWGPLYVGLKDVFTTKV